MENISDEERCALVNSTDNSVKMALSQDGGGEEEEDEDEALSLCDLPLIRDESRNENEEDVTPLRHIETEEDFDFCSLSRESEMCAADEVFYRGQILPLRHSISSKKGFLQYCNSRDFSRSISTSGSVDGYSSGGLISSRSSSIGSHQSSSSSSSGSSAAATEPKPTPRNQFHSHPSPSPRTHFSGNRRGMPRINAKKSSAWNIFRLGLVAAPPEISFHDLKTRCPSKSILGSYISNSGEKKIKTRDFLRRCKLCSADAVDTVPSKVVNIKRSASDGENEVRELQVEAENFPAPKKRSSHRRTFEWLKQLSLEEGAADEP